ncbi:hypothetical protein Tco_0524106 [Tanacetum coccineum]
MAHMQGVAINFLLEEDWDTIQAKLEANADLVKEIEGGRVYEACSCSENGVGMERFVPMDTEKESRKRTGEELQTESSKKLKSNTREDVSVPKEKEKEIAGKLDLQSPGTEEDVEAYMEERVDEPSSEEFPMGFNSIRTQPPAKIVKWQIIRHRKTSAFISHRGKLTRDNRPKEGFERVLCGDLNTMFDPPSTEDVVWNLTHQQKVLSWRYFHSCVVHCLTLEAAQIYMLTEVKYPLPPRVCKAMLEKKLLGDRKDEVWYQLLKLIEKQAQQQQ